MNYLILKLIWRFFMSRCWSLVAGQKKKSLVTFTCIYLIANSTTFKAWREGSALQLLIFKYEQGDKLPLNKGNHVNCGIPRAISGAGPGKCGVLERPTIERTTPGRESEFDLRKSRKMAPPYRVILHNDNFNKREYVVQILMKVIPGMTLDTAVNVMQEAHYNGLAVVIVCAQADAEEHCTQLRGNGLLSSIEPEGGGC